MGIPGLINELGSGHRISLAKFCLDFFPRHSRPPRIAIDVSIWLFQIQAGRGGANPELRTLFYRLERLVALPVHPLFVFDGPEKPEYKRGKLVYRSENAAAYVIRLAKRLIELFKFPWHSAPGEAEAECGKLQSEGVVDAVMSDDVDAVMFGSKVTMRNFSKEASSGTKAATHVNVCRVTDTPDGEANVSLDQGGMILFAMLSGGDYLPAGVPKCGPKLAGEIARAKFGSDLLEIIRENSPNMHQKLNEWRDRLNYELQTNESGHFKSKHKAVQIPDSFPDLRILFDYVCPVTSSRAELKKLCGRLIWDSELDVQQLRAFLCEELGWNYLLGAKRLIRTIAPQIVSQKLRLPGPIVPDSTRLIILRQRENFSMDGTPELKLQFIPADVVKLDLEPPSSQQSEPADIEEEDSEEDQEETVGTSRKQRYQSYDPSQPDSAWIPEPIVRMGLPDMVASWHAEQRKKESSKARSSKKSTSRKKGAPKILDPTMTPGAILRFGTIVKHRASKGSVSAEPPLSSPLDSGKAPNSTPLPDDIPTSSGRSPRKIRSAVDPKTTPAQRRLEMGREGSIPNNIEAPMDFADSEEGISLPPSSATTKLRSPNRNYSFARHIDGLNAGVMHPSRAHTDASDGAQDVSNTTPASNETTALSFETTVQVSSKLPAGRYHRLSAESTDVSRQRMKQSREPKGAADLAVPMSKLSVQPALESSSSMPGPQSAEPALTQEPKTIDQSLRPTSRKPADNSRMAGDNHGKKQIPNDISTSTYANKMDGGDAPTSRRISGIIEAHDGTWTYQPKSRDPDPSSEQSKASKDADANSDQSFQSEGEPKPGRMKRITRVSVLDLTT